MGDITQDFVRQGVNVKVKECASLEQEQFQLVVKHCDHEENTNCDQ